MSPRPFTSVPPGYTPKTSAPLIWALRLSPLAVLLKRPPVPEDTDEVPWTPNFPVPETPVPPEAANPMPSTPVPPSPETPTPEPLLTEPATPKVTPDVAPAKPVTAVPLVVALTIPSPLGAHLAVASNSRTFAGAHQELRSTLQEAKRFGYVELELETSLALLELENKSSGGARLRERCTLLEDEARTKGYGLIARKTAALRSSERALTR